LTKFLYSLESYDSFSFVHLRFSIVTAACLSLPADSRIKLRRPFMQYVCSLQSAWYGRITASTPGRSHPAFERQRPAERADIERQENHAMPCALPYNSPNGYNNLASHILTNTITSRLGAWRWLRCVGQEQPGARSILQTSSGPCRWQCHKRQQANTFSMRRALGKHDREPSPPAMLISFSDCGGLRRRAIRFGT